MHQGRWADAPTIFHQELELRDPMVESTNTIHITFLSDLEKVLTLLKAYTEAVCIFWLSVPPHNARKRRLAGDRQSARQQISILLNGLQLPWREMSDVIIDHLTYVAMACREIS